MCARVCHDLISPVGAVNNGCELLGEEGADFTEQAKRLIGDSASQAARKLAFFRFAFGTGGSGDTVDTEWLTEIASGFFQGGKISLEWDFPEPEFPQILGKLLLNLLLCAAECLPRGGSLTSTCRAQDQSPALSMTAAGRNLSEPEEILNALRGSASLEILNARTVPGVLVAHYAESIDKSLKIKRINDEAVEFLLA